MPAAMQTCPFHSFLETPILFLTAQVRFGLPVLGDHAVHAILRDVWLKSARRDRWFVGPYCVQPDRVSLLACPGRAARSVTAWTTVWKAAAAVRIESVTGGCGQLWEFGVPPEPVVSAADYRARCAALLAEPTAAAYHAGVFVSHRQEGVLWQLLPVGLPEPVAVR